MLHFLHLNKECEDCSASSLAPIEDLEQLCNSSCHEGEEKENPFYLYHYMPLFSLLHFDQTESNDENKTKSGCEKDGLFMRDIGTWNDPYEHRMFRIKMKDNAKGEEFYHPLQGHVYGTCFTTGYNAEAQWKVYDNPQNGPSVLVKFDFSKLMEALHKSSEKFYVGFVNYYNQQDVGKVVKHLVEKYQEIYKESAEAESSSLHEINPRQMEKLLLPFLIKRQAFSYEREVRILSVTKPKKEKTYMAPLDNYTQLISSITLSPYCSKPWQDVQKKLLENSCKHVWGNTLFRKTKTVSPIIINE